MRLEVFDQSQAKNWNDIIDRSLNGTLFHTWEWLKIIEKHSDTKLLPLVFFDADDDKPFGAIPLFLMKRLGLKLIFSPPPASAASLGPVLVKKDYKQHKFEMSHLDFQSNIDIYIKSLGVNYIYIMTTTGLLDIRPFSWNGYKVNPSYTYKIDLSQGEKTVWANLSSSLKNDINKTRKSGVKVIKNGFDRQQVANQIYDTLTDCYDRQHLKLPLKKAYLQNIIQQFKESGIRMAIAEYNNQVVGGQILLDYKDTITGWVGSVRPESNNLEINGLMIWEMMSDGIKEGYKWFENMGANTRHLCGYKSKFDPAIQIYFEMKKTGILGSLAEKAYFLKRRNIRKEDTAKTVNSFTHYN